MPKEVIMERFTTLKGLVKAVKQGQIDESELSIIMDNDCSFVYLAGQERAIYRGQGYYDIEDLWPLIFPKAKVEWC
jgi:hypothetical protein